MVLKPWYSHHCYPKGGPVFIEKVLVQIDAGNDDGTLESTLGELTADGPFVVGKVEFAAAGRRRCTFDIMYPGLAVGFRSVIELQHRIARKYEIVSVECHKFPNDNRKSGPHDAN